MGKIICEVCGTSYSEAAGQCPICGTARPGNSVPVSGGAADQSGRRAYQHVKGGRFSKSNVRKRNKVLQDNGQSVSGGSKGSKKGGKNTGLVITAVLLILAILAVLIYIAVHFLGDWILRDTGNPGIINKPAVSDTEPVLIPCTGINLQTNVIELEPVGATVASEMIQYSLLPANTTDPVIFRSEDPTVATVTDKGKVAFVSGGQTQIVITCGEMEAVCKVRCIVEETTVPETTAETTVPEKTFTLSEETLYLYFVGDEGTIKTGDIDPVQITWKSSDAEIATVSEGVVTQTGVGTVDIQASYGGQTLVCKVICTDDLGSGTGGDITEEGSSGTVQGGDSTGSGTYKIKNLYGAFDTEATVNVGETFYLEIWENDDEVSDPENVEWKTSNENTCTCTDGVVKAVGSGSAYITATYQGKEYKFEVRVI